ncbi:hypothetical protein [Ruegeria lacuscaerulensis]|uniref:hypothetical protein n=1 Tax=Ruegeria lacuscaerulensis TaxID=55218 RepID=UPI00147E3E64|nr:hypothetical protein [Ruegeria lacuscaerulensis]
MARVPEIIRRNPISQVAARPPEAGQGFRALSEIFKAGADFVKPAAQDQARQEGESAVFRDENGNLQVDERSPLGGEMAEIHNAAAYGKYLGQKRIDIMNTMSELFTKNEFDPDGFRQDADAYVKLLQADENIPGVLKEELIAGVKQEASRNFNGLHRKQVQRDYDASDKNTATARDMLVDDFVNLYTSGDMDAAELKWKEIEAISEFRGSAPYITETPAEVEEYMRGARGAAKAAKLIRELDTLDGQSEISDAKREEVIGLLNDPDISPGTRQKLYAATHGKLKGIDATAMVNALTDGSYEAMIVRAESAGVDTAQNPNSTALGPHQFIKGTWLGLVKKHKPEWAKGLSEGELLGLRADREKSSEMFAHFRAANQGVLAAAGLPVTPATEYLAHFFGAGGAVDVLSASPTAMVSDVVSADVIKANPFLEGKTVSWVANWATRKMTMKATDIAAMGAQLASIEDPEVRGLAAKALNGRVAQRELIEQAAADEVSERIASGEGITEQQIMENHDLSTRDQAKFSKELQKARKEQADMQTTVANLNNPDFGWDIYDTKQRNAIDDAFKASLDGESPMSDQGLASSLRIADRTGFVPKSTFNALRGAMNSDDPETLSRALEFAGNALDVQATAITPYGGRSEIERALSDYRFHGQFMDGTEAAQKIIDARQDVPKNVSDEAKKQVKKLSISDVSDHFDKSWFSSPDLGSDREQFAIMSEYQRLFKDAYIETGEFDTAQARALDQMGRVYGTNAVTGSDRLMKYPPQKFYPAINGSHDWMTRQAVDEISAEAFGKDSNKRLDPGNIKLVSDPITQKQVMSGQTPTYVAYYMKNGVLEQLPMRYGFDATADQTAQAERDKAIFDHGRGREFLHHNAGLFNPETEAKRFEERARVTNFNRSMGDE